MSELITARRASALSVLKVCGVISTVILSGFALWALRHILTPLVLAVFLLLMVDGLARALRDRIPGFPDRAALPVAVILIVGLFALTIWQLVQTATDFSANSHMYEDKLNAILEKGSAQLGLTVTPTVAELIKRLNPAHYGGEVAKGFSSFGEHSVFVLIYLGFLVASRQGFGRKTKELFATDSQRKEAARVFSRIRKGVESYVWVQTVVGVMIAGASAIVMAAMGLNHIVFLTLIIFLFNYIPAIGAALGVMLPPLLGLVEFDQLWQPIVLLAILEGVHFSVSHVVQPRMQGKSLNVDPIVVLLALAFWGAIWGVVGAFLSTPLTVMAMAILAEFKGARPLAVLLSGDGKPYADTSRL
jgi:predicted PurR-regulated permease PerM